MLSKMSWFVAILNWLNSLTYRTRRCISFFFFVLCISSWWNILNRIRCTLRWILSFIRHINIKRTRHWLNIELRRIETWARLWVWFLLTMCLFEIIECHHHHRNIIQRFTSHWHFQNHLNWNPTLMVQTLMSQSRVWESRPHCLHHLSTRQFVENPIT